MAFMAASKELVSVEEEQNESGLSERQVQALDKLAELGASPRSSEDEPYSSDPKVRAYQLILEGRFAGPGRGQGRVRKPRVAEVMAEEMRRRGFGKRMMDALDRALIPEAGSKTNLEAIKIAVDIENREASLKLKEEVVDESIGNTKDEVLATLFELVEQPQTAAAIEGFVVAEEDIEEAQVVEDEDDATDEHRQTSVARTNGSSRDSSRLAKAGRNGGNARPNGRRGSSSNRPSSTNPFSKAAVRRAS